MGVTTLVLNTGSHFLTEPRLFVVMADLRTRFVNFPWIPSFIVSILAGLIFFFVENPKYIPQSVKITAQLVIQYSIIAIAIGGLVAGCLSLYFNRQQKWRWNQFEKELEERSRRKEKQSNNITKSSIELLIGWIDKVEDLLWISEDGEVTITAKNLNDAQKFILYLIGIRYAFELNLIESPEVDTGEIARKTKVPHMSIQGWYLPLDDVIEKRHLEIWERYDEGPFDKYQLNIENVDQAFHYVTGDEDLPEPLYFG